ncbi:MAG TPA: TIGR00730 family Rossman fold protein [Bacteroidetes bacterium]|nr:TIGR00730 family Rossman fold protein [Bacteroidota bacterium]
MGYDDVYRDAAHHVARFFTDNNIGLVYGGANVGLMKVLADVMLSEGKEVIGVMPTKLIRREVAHNNLTRMINVESMAERKEKMVELSDGFITLPGGFGTFDELSEILTFNQLRITDKPIGILNVNGYFDKLLQFFDHAVTEGFVRKEHRNNLVVSDNISDLFLKMNEYKPLTIGKWIKDIVKESHS